ncbi:hypothetical protein F5878DRAFT_646886, partial [Lentinula raphanica]
MPGKSFEIFVSDVNDPFATFFFCPKEKTNWGPRILPWLPHFFFLGVEVPAAGGVGVPVAGGVAVAAEGGVGVPAVGKTVSLSRDGAVAIEEEEGVVDMVDAVRDKRRHAEEPVIPPRSPPKEVVSDWALAYMLCIGVTAAAEASRQKKALREFSRQKAAFKIFAKNQAKEAQEWMKLRQNSRVRKGRELAEEDNSQDENVTPSQYVFILLEVEEQ